MELVVDTNVAAAAILRKGMTRELVFHPRLKLRAPDYLMEELAEHRQEFETKAALAAGSFDNVCALVMANIAQAHRNEYAEFEAEGRRISPDPDDYPFLALAMRLGCAVWSNDRRLKRQKQVRVYDTEELVQMLRKGLL